MSPAEQESLLLRQVAALRRQGVPHDQALARSGAGLPTGALRDTVHDALRALAAGSTPQGSGLGALLGRGTVDVSALEVAAQARDARLSAMAALRLTRVYAGIALAGPLLLGSALAWLVPGLQTPDGAVPGPWVVLGAGATVLRFAGLPLAVAALLALGRLAPRLAPGATLIQRAADLLDADDSAAPELIDPLEHAFFDARRQRVGAASAARELAFELVQEGEERVQRFRHLAPVAGAVGGAMLLLPLLALVFLPIFGMAAL